MVRQGQYEVTGRGGDCRGLRPQTHPEPPKRRLCGTHVQWNQSQVRGSYGSGKRWSRRDRASLQGARNLLCLLGGGRGSHRGTHV